ncbi:hypothetical protein HPB47_013800, partial [Ixodes persulcatus]
PGKAAIYVKYHLQHAPIDLSKWCTSRQEVVAVLIPIIVGGDFNAPNMKWGYKQDSSRGRQVYDRFTDRRFHLLNLPGPTRLGDPSNAPELTWWLQVTDSDKLRSSLNITAQNPETVQRAFKEAMLECTMTTTVHCDQPTPDPHLLRLWQQRPEAHLEALWRTFHAMERPHQAEGRTGNIQLRLELTDDEFAARAAATFFPRHASPSKTPSRVLVAAPLQDMDGLPYEVYKNLEGEAVTDLLAIINKIWEAGELSTS